MNVRTANAGGMRSVAAFTLLEVLVAVAVFAIVLTAMHLVLHGALRLRNRTVSNLDRAVPVEHVLGILRRDLANLTAPGGTLRAGLVDSTSSMATNTTGLYGAEFYTTSGRLDATEPWGDIQRVSYHLADSTNRGSLGRDLYRTVTRNLLPTFEEEPEQEWLLAGVEELRVEFFDGYEWLQMWDTTTTNTLPVAVRVEIEMAEEDERMSLASRAPIALVVPLEIQPRTAQSTPSSDTEGGEL